MALNQYITHFLLAVFVTIVVVYFLIHIVRISKIETLSEGFSGPARGGGIPDCFADSKEASDLYTFFSSKEGTTEEGPDDFRELTLLLSKTNCLKKDLMSPSGIVEATRYQAFSTAHDIEPVAETAARCMAKTIPPRDLDIVLEKWTKRGKELVRRLCTNYKLSDSEVTKASNLLNTVMLDISNIAKSQCLKGEVQIAGTVGPRDASPYEPPELSELKEYKGYY